MTETIELVKESEVTLLRDICISTFKNTFKDGEYSKEDFKQYFDEAYSVEKLKKELEDAYAFTYFYRVNNQVVGYFKLNINEAQTEQKGNEYLEIQRIYFLSRAQGGGRGKHVFEFAIEKARELKKNKIWLGVWEHNKQALNFYEKQGLRVTGEHHFYTGNVVDIDLIMEKDI